MLDILKNKNKDIEILNVNSDEFSSYGRIISGLDVDEIIKVAKSVKNSRSV